MRVRLDVLVRPLGRNWREDAACGLADPYLFEERVLTGPMKRLPLDIVNAAQNYCKTCPVLRECKAEADANTALRGLLGGVYRTLSLTKSRGQGAYRTFDLLAPQPTPVKKVRRRVLNTHQNAA